MLTLQSLYATGHHKGSKEEGLLRSATEAAEKATRWLWIKMADPWAMLLGHKLRFDQPLLYCLGEGV